MRAFVVEFAGHDDAAARGILEGAALELPGDSPAGTSGEGRLQPPERPSVLDRSEGEPA